MPASREAASAEGRTTGRAMRIQNNNSKQEFKRMKKGNVHENVEGNVQENVDHQEAMVPVRLRRLHLPRLDCRDRRPDRELFSGHPAAPGDSGAQQLDALSAHL